MTLEALDKVLDFIEDNNLKKPTRIDYINYLIGYFIFNQNIPNESLKKKLISWYNKVDFRNKSNSDRREFFNELINIQ